MAEYHVYTFYKFVLLDDYARLRQPLLDLMRGAFVEAAVEDCSASLSAISFEPDSR